MYLYIILVLFLALFSYLKVKNSFYIILLLFLISILRAETVGIDYIGFKNAFKYEIPFLDFKIALLKYEPGWLFINKIIYTYLNNFIYVIILSSFLTIAPFFYVVKKKTIYSTFGIFLYVSLFYYFFAFSLIRQFISISLVLLATYHYIENNRKLTILFYIFASLFHYSSIFAIILIITLRIIKPNKNILLFLLGATFLIGYFGNIDSYTKIFQYLPFQKYANYEFYKSNIHVNKLNIYLFFIPQNLLAYFILLKNKKYSFFSLLFIVGVLIENLFISFPLISRLVYYFLIFEIFAIIELQALYNNKYNKLLYMSIVYVYCSLYFCYYIYNNRAGIIPYELIN